MTDADVDRLCEEYAASYTPDAGPRKGGARHQSLRDAARIELALRAFLEDGDFQGFTDTFENLHGLKQLPGIAAQRLMADGYGFGAEGDWKHAALVRAMKVMAHGLAGGTSASWRTTPTTSTRPVPPCSAPTCSRSVPSIAAGKPSCEVHPLAIGGKEDPVRLVFDAATGDAVNASIVDMGNRFRMVVNEVEVISPPEKLPKLPVARALWIPQPSLAVAAAAWIHAGGAHHTGFSQALTPEHLEDFAAMAGIEFLLIDGETTLRDFKNELRWNDAAYLVAGALR